MIFALLYAGLLVQRPDPYDAVEEAQRHAKDCEQRIIGDSFLGGPMHERPLADQMVAARQQCAGPWADHAKARQVYYQSNRRLLRRLVPGFRPRIEACWVAFDGQRHDWPGAPKNTALKECKNAKN